MASRSVQIFIFMIGYCMATVVIDPSGRGQNCAIVVNIFFMILKMLQNGIVYENGISRSLTDGEKEQLDFYNEQWRNWSQDFAKNTFPPGFPFHETSQTDSEEGIASTTPPLTTPKFPCICSGCKQPGNTGI